MGRCSTISMVALGLLVSCAGPTMNDSSGEPDGGSADAGAPDSAVSADAGNAGDADVPVSGCENRCHPVAACVRAERSYVCVCPIGYIGDGSVCDLVDACLAAPGSCSSREECVDVGGEPTCRCKEGYERVGSDCEMAGPCSPGCGFAGRCVNGTCTCREGYVRRDGRCWDIDECVEGTHDCESPFVCENKLDGFNCVCPDGYRRKNRTCELVAPCVEAGFQCHFAASCVDAVCVCDDGYIGDGELCLDIDECVLGTHNCESPAICVDESGGFSCACPRDFAPNGTGCDPLTECAAAGVFCHSDARCEGSECVCNSGYEGDGLLSCIDIDECAEGTYECPAGMVCSNFVGSFRCIYPPIDELPGCGEYDRTVYVDAGATGDGSGADWQNAVPSLSAALALPLRPGQDELWVAAGTYVPVGVTRSFIVSERVAIFGGFAGGETTCEQRDPEANLTTLSGDVRSDDGPNFLNRSDNVDTVVIVEAKGVRLDGLTIRGGGSSTEASGFDGGGGVRLRSNPNTVESSSVLLSGVVLTDNQSAQGGGMFLVSSGGEAVVEHSLVHRNRGGGINPFESTSITVRDTTFSGNQGTALGGTFRFSSLECARCTFIDNTAEVGAGIVYGTISDSVAIEERFLVTDSVFERNVAEWGGAARIVGVGAITRCIFRGNRATVRSGGALSLFARAAGVSHNLFIDNQAAGHGGALALSGDPNDGSSASVRDSVFVGNSAGGDGGGLSSVGFRPRFSNLVFVGNNAVRGGAMSIDKDITFFQPATSIRQTTFFQNRAQQGGAIAHVNFDIANPVVVHSSVFGENVAMEDGGGDAAWSVAGLEGFNEFIVSFSNVDLDDIAAGGLLTDGGGNIDSDPLFADPANPIGPDGIFATSDDGLILQATSPAKDTADPDNSADDDIVGTVRPQGAGPDMGAYETLEP